MIHIDFNYSNASNNVLNENGLKNTIFRITPITASELKNNLSYRYPLYGEINPNEYKEFFQKFWLKIQEWTSNNLSDFNKQAIKIATFHLSSHFCTNYLSTKAIIKNLIKNDGGKSKFNLILTEDMVYIDGDWCSSFISFLACIHALEECGCNYQIDPSSTLIYSRIIAKNTHIYVPFYSYKKINKKDNSFFEKINSAKFLSYTLHDRYNFFKKFDGNINILPKSVAVLDNAVGIYNQFNFNIFEDRELNIKSWQEFTLSESLLLINIETNYFDSLGLEIFEAFRVAEKGIADNLKETNIEALLIDEIVDIESLPLLSACAKMGIQIHVTQHSSNPVNYDLLGLITDEENILSVIWPISNFAFNFYSKYHLPRERNPIVEGYDFRRNGNESEYVILIENDLIRKFGINQNIGMIIDDLSELLSNLTELGINKYIWRQRTSDNTAVISLLQEKVPNAQIIFDPQTLSIDDLSKLAKVSIGFGIGSSLSQQLVVGGVVNFFASNKFSEFEYVPEVKEFHHAIGLDYCLSKIPQVLKNESIYVEMLAKQQLFLESI